MKAELPCGVRRKATTHQAPAVKFEPRATKSDQLSCVTVSALYPNGKMRTYLSIAFSVLCLLFLVEGSVIPLDKRAPAPVDTRGSASISWYEQSYQRVHIRTFHVNPSNRIVLTKYDDSATGSGWTTKILDLWSSSSVSAMSLRENTPQHVIHLYFSVNGKLNSAVFDVAKETW